MGYGFQGQGQGAASVQADEYQDTINIFRKADESGKFFGKAYGYAVFPTSGKGGIGLGGAYGTGHVYERGKHIGDVSMTQLSLGFRLGGQGFSQIIYGMVTFTVVKGGLMHEAAIAGQKFSYKPK